MYEKQINDMTWSFSRLSSFEQCPYSFYLNYILHDRDRYPNEGNFYAENGHFVHEILEMIFKKELDVEDATDYYISHFKENVLCKVKKETKAKTYEACADYFATVDFDWLKNYEILGVEKEVRFNIEGYDFVGYIDLLLRDKRDNRIVVLDHKSSDYPFNKNGTVKASSQHSFSKYKKQMYLYSYAVYLEYGEFPKELVWQHFKVGGKLAIVPFKKEEYDEAVKWMTNTIHNIELEEDYEPKEDFFYCLNLCGFRNSCEYAKKTKQKMWRKR